MLQDKKNLLFPNTFTLLLVTLSLFLSFSACQPNASRGTKDGNKRFHTNDPAVLYFKNIKSLKYQVFRDPDSQMDYYQPKSFSESGGPKIWPVLIHNWLQDEVYLNMGTRNLSSGAIVGEMKRDSTISVIGWPEENNLSQFEFLIEMERYIQKGANLVIKTSATTNIPLVYAQNERTAFATTIQDFLSLTDNRDNN